MNSEPATSRATTNVPSPRHLDIAAGFLSYLVPGLGQITQGRIGKGLLFFVGIYGLFFYGLALGQWQNVFFPNTSYHIKSNWRQIFTDLWARPQFLGQFWVGAAAWPAV